MRIVFAAILTVSFTATTVSAQDLGKPPRIWKSAPDGAEVLASTFLGGRGTEWLAAGGFQPDGSIVLVGNVLGPTLDLSVPVKVIGTDLPAPAEPNPIAVLDKGKPKHDKDGKPVFEKPSWRHEGVTTFVALYSADLQKLRAVHRFPWTAGAATAAAIGPDGSIYIAGRATAGIAKLGGDVMELEAIANPAKANPQSVRCDHSFLAKLSADGSKALWVRHVRGPSAAPTVDLGVNGQIRFGAGRVHVLDADGKLLSTRTIPGGLRTTSSINPKTDEIVVGGEHHWATGREPWRCPTLNIHRTDGTLKHQFYDWGGPYVGLDNCRQVSDTAVRYVTHDPDGSIVLYAWSDGGNSVATTQPFDVREPVGHRGLGMTTAGAGVLSAAYLIRLDPKDYRVTAWTLWLPNDRKGKPNSIWIEQLARVPDGSLAFAGKSAWGVWQTKDKLTDAEPQGEYLAVLTEDFAGLRYSSVIPGAGAADLNDGAATRGSGWGIATGTVKGKSRVLFLAGATEGRMEDGKMVPTPTRNAVQTRFGGGRSDGYVVLMELATPTAKPAIVTAKATSGPTRASFEGSAKPGKAKGEPIRPADGTVFHFSPTYPKWVTVDAEVRDQAGKLSPAFLYGKPVEGTLTYRQAGLDAKFTVACTAVCQPNGEPDGRLLGELLKDPKSLPPWKLTLDSIGPIQKAELKIVEKVKESARTVDYHDAKGTLELGGKKIAVSPRVTIGYSGPKGGAIETARLNAYLTMRACELGLRSPTPDALIDIRFGMNGTTQNQAPPKKQKKS
jgi:hypothetical protein